MNRPFTFFFHRSAVDETVLLDKEWSERILLTVSIKRKSWIDFMLIWSNVYWIYVDAKTFLFISLEHHFDKRQKTDKNQESKKKLLCEIR